MHPIRETVASLCQQQTLIVPARWLYRLRALNRFAQEGSGCSFQPEVALANSETAEDMARLGRTVVVAPPSGLLPESRSGDKWKKGPDLGRHESYWMSLQSNTFDLQRKLLPSHPAQISC